MKILVIDDDVSLAGIIEEFLTDHQHQVLLAHNGRSGLATAVEQNPQCIVLDVELPDMNGYEVCRKIREVPQLRHTPVIMLTGLSGENNEVEGLKSGADDYVGKPFKPKSLLARIEAAVGRNRNQLEASPLTHLPGNQLIAQELEKRIQSGEKFSVLYLDLNNFKSFNDRYGFLRGDEAIHKTAAIIQAALSRLPTKSFLGHVGGDDFVAILDSHEAEDVCKNIISRFDQGIRELYAQGDLERGVITSTDRKGNKVDVPIMGLAIAVVTNKLKAFQHPGEISVVAGDLKKWVKTKVNSAYAIDRRS